MTHQATQPKFTKINQPSSFEFFSRFPDEDSAREYLINARWPDGIICVHCGHDEVWRIRQGKLFTCKECRKQFTVRKGTVMEDSPIPLRKWLFAMYLFGIHHKGVASTNMAKQIGVTQKTAWFMDHRLREAFADDGIVLEGVVEADETWIGGKERNKHERDRLHAGRGGIGKTAVLGMKQRDGETVAFPITDTTQESLAGSVEARVTPGSKVYTDEHKGYGRLRRKYRHERVKHSAGEYVRGQVHTNSIEGVWSMVKRSHYGIYHMWSKKHLHRYIAEITKRQNMQEIPAFDDSNGAGITMVRLLMSGLVGRRLTYQALTHG